MGNDDTGKGGGNHQKQKPGNPLEPDGKDAGFEVGLLDGRHSVHLCEVLLRLFLNDVDSIVDGNDTDQTVFLIDYRNGKQVVFFDQLTYILLVGVRGCADDRRVHYVGYHNILALRRH